MLNPIRFVKDLFDDEDLSDVKLQPFANDHLIRLGNNNPGGIYSQMITDTTNAYTGFYGRLTDQAVKEAISEGLTITMNNANAAVLDKLSKQRDLVAYKFGDESDVYQEFFPQGLTAYRKATLDELPNMLDGYLVAATAHLNADFPAEVTEVGGLINAYENARNAQLSAFSQTDSVRTGRREDRKVLTLQLTKNMLTLAIDFLEDPDRFDDYYDDKWLPITKEDGGEEPQPPTGTSVTLEGTVVDEPTQTGLADVEVTLSSEEGSITVTTDAQGKYVIEIPELNQASATAQLTAAISTHVSQSREVTIEPGGEYTEDFELTPITP